MPAVAPTAWIAKAEQALPRVIQSSGGQVLSYAGQKAGAEGVSRPCGFHYGKALVDARKKGGLTIFEIGTSAA